MNGNGVDFEKKFGEKWAKMSDEERYMAIYLAITDFYAFARKQDGFCKTVDRHALYWKITIWCICIVIVAIVGKVITTGKIF